MPNITGVVNTTSECGKEHHTRRGRFLAGSTALMSSTSVSSSIAAISLSSWGLLEESEEIDIESVNDECQTAIDIYAHVPTRSAAFQRVDRNHRGRRWVEPPINNLLWDVFSGNFEDSSAHVSIYWDA